MLATQAKQIRYYERTYLHPLPIRIWHWINALGFVGLILTGIQLRYSDLFSLLTFETALKLHNWIGFVVIANYFLWLGYYLSSDRISNYHPVLDAKSFFDNYFRQMVYYSYGIFRGESRPHKVQPYNKFNPMQRLTYQFVMMISVPIQFLTGLMMWDVQRFGGWIEMVGGIRVVSTIHVVWFILFVFFTGYEEPGGH
jgi:thiosulfate reductase cytochrome b subunit